MIKEYIIKYDDDERKKDINGGFPLIEKPQELIRCKDCKHSCDYTDIYPDRAYKCTKNGGYHNDSWFCADGKPKD